MKTAIRCMIVDDEPLAREAIRSCIALDPTLEIVGEAGDGQDAIRAIEDLRPDLLFLDVQMPEVDGFEVLQELMSKSIKLPLTIFVTAYDSYALRAFEAHALDYLLKPIRGERFKDAVSVAKSRIASDRSRQVTDQLASLLARSELVAGRPKRLPVKVKGRIVFLRLDEIEWIESEGNYVRLHASGESYSLRETLSAVEAKLDPAQFMRIHRCNIVNINHIKDLRPWFTGEYIVRMQSGKELTLTRSYRETLQRLLGKNQG
jgi:two-component system, LytTR family, response regulator